MPETVDLETAAEILSTAATLGMPIPAPVGTHIYYYEIKTSHKFAHTIETSGIYSTYDGALRSFAETIIAKSDKHPDAPWIDKTFWEHVTHEDWIADMDGWLAKYATHQETLRQEFINTRTAKQIIEHFVGAENLSWEIKTKVIKN